MVEVFAANAPTYCSANGGDGSLVERDGETFYKISDYHTMPAFLMAMASGYDHWMFVSSTGGLTCGRQDIESALFPYYTDDKIHDACATTGPFTAFLIEIDGKTRLWQPFNPGIDVYSVSRNLYKNRTGNKLIFEEQNHDLGLSFSFSWSTGDQYGFIRQSQLINEGTLAVAVRVLDGFRNILPSGVNSSVQDSKSTLLDGYKQAEAFAAQTAAVYNMSSTLTDRALPSEALQAAVVWCQGLESATVLLSEDQIKAFCGGHVIHPEAHSHGKRGAFLVNAGFDLAPAETRHWRLVADVQRSPSQLVALLHAIDQGITPHDLDDDIEAGTRRLLALAGDADGCQWSTDALITGRHFSNTLFNIMRGGTFYDAYSFPLDDFLDFVGIRNRSLQPAFQNLLATREPPFTVMSVLQMVNASGNSDMQRMALEYLPLTFSRRHGDPSRPWNHFSIDIRNPDGSDKLFYQGNWRDIFQNWEALAFSYPEFSESLIAKFVNASTADGYNPYRITKNGFEWEVLDAEDPWSNIGYWGDHQVTYLQKLMEFSRRYHPDRVADLLSREIFVYADVPYRLKSYQDLLAEPRNGVDYDHQHASDIAGRVRKTGSDGQLMPLADGSVYKVNLLEKLLVMILAKLGNLVPDGGIWMNTQRPEWNDANNALVGNGLSVVTMCYLRKFLYRFAGLLRSEQTTEFAVSVEVLACFDATRSVFRDYAARQEDLASGSSRKQFVDALQLAGQSYRDKVYADFSGGKSSLNKSLLQGFIEDALRLLDQSIKHNQRDDDLFHAYNLIHISDEEINIEHLYEMLEGQVAALNSGILDARRSLALLDALKSSAMYRPDQNSYMLYPNRSLPPFLQKNCITPALLESCSWLQVELASGRTDFVEQDLSGDVHFNTRFINAEELAAKLSENTAIKATEREQVCAVYEQVFNHRHFTGRSGAMYKYEGLGCIYWHMVSKLLLATADVISAIAAGNGVNSEACADASTGTVAEVSAGTNAVNSTGDGRECLPDLLRHFDEIKAGIGAHKRPADYGAFPTDPYSHTPGFSGVQQPGMTGQVKEDIVARFRELGVTVKDGEITFFPVILKQSEFAIERQEWRHARGGNLLSETLEAGSMAFTMCGIPVIYRLAESANLNVHYSNGNMENIAGNRLSSDVSRAVFQRDQQILKIEVDIRADTLRK